MQSIENLKIKEDNKTPFFSFSNWFVLFCVVLILGLGIGFRLMRLSSPALDVHAWRWLRSAIDTQAMYYEMDPNIDPEIRDQAIGFASRYAHSEPQISERIVAISYLVAGGEYLWIYRIWMTIFWTIGGIAAFLLAEKIASRKAAILTLGYFMLLPFANTQTLAFIPEPLMVMLIMLALYSASCWVDSQSWKWAIITGILAGLAIYSKVFAIYFIGPPLLLLSLSRFGFKKTFSNWQVWAVGLLAVLIPASYYVIPNLGLGGNYLSTWSIPYLGRLKDVTFYISWIHKLNGNFNFAILLISVVSVSLLEKKWRGFIFGLWIGYLFLGLSLPALIWSHSYYNLPLVGIVAVSLAPIAKLFIDKVSKEGLFWKLLVLGICAIAVAFSVFMSRKDVVANDYSSEAQKWDEISDIISDHSVIGFTEDYDMRLAYYATRAIGGYPRYYNFIMGFNSENNAEITEENQNFFDQIVAGYQLFLVTEFREFELQPYVRKILYEQYSIYDQSDWYILFNLEQPLD